MQKANKMSKEGIRLEKLERKCDLLAQGLATLADLVSETFDEVGKVSPLHQQKALCKGKVKAVMLIANMAEEVERIDGC